MIYDIKTENELRKLAGLPLKEAEGGSLDNIIAKHREAFESVMRGESMLFDHDEFYDELYEHYVSSGEMPYGIAKARDGDPDQWIQEKKHTKIKKLVMEKAKLIRNLQKPPKRDIRMLACIMTIDKKKKLKNEI